MSEPQNSDADLESFSGRAPLFPLTNVVLFPHAVLPLHVFEPRYRQLTADALAGDGCIAMALLRSAADHDVDDLPAIHDVVGLGRIIAHEKLPDGRYYLALRGLTRARVTREVPSDRLYRIGRLELCPDRAVNLSTSTQDQLCGELTARTQALLPKLDLDRVFQQALALPLPLAALCDAISAALPLPAPVLQTLQDELDVASRCQKLIKLLGHLQGDEPQPPPVRLAFPPTFSPN